MSRRPTRDVVSIYATRRSDGSTSNSSTSASGGSQGHTSGSSSLSASIHGVESAEESKGKKNSKGRALAEQLNPWVECNHCKKWRKLPLNIDLSTLPETWYCKMNRWDPLHNSCDIEQEEAVETTSKKSSRSKANQANKESKAETSNPWVQCNTCNKWRKLPLEVDVSSLPTVWECSMNHWDPAHKTCSAPEESYEDMEDAPLKSFFKLWLKRIRCASKVEVRLAQQSVLTNSVLRGRKRKQEVETEWIRCSNPHCGKWRAFSVRGASARQVIKKLNSGRVGWVDHKPLEWYCSMNTWDETVASCSAPQDPLFDAPWNLQTTGGSEGSTNVSGVTSSSTS